MYTASHCLYLLNKRYRKYNCQYLNDEIHTKSTWNYLQCSSWKETQKTIKRYIYTLVVFRQYITLANLIKYYGDGEATLRPRKK